ncbi:MAG: ATP-binding protein [Myxococcota bacterium]
MWTVLVGRNGLCKTSLLRAIALAASGRDLANELSTEQRQSFQDLRHEGGKMEIRAKFGFGEIGAGLGREFPPLSADLSPDYLGVRLSLSPGARSLDGRSWYFSNNSSEAPNNSAKDTGKVLEMEPATGSPLEDVRQSSLPHWFVAGYGVQRLLPGVATTKSPDDFVRVRLETLFDAGTLISTDFADHLAKRFGAKEADGFAGLLHHALLGDDKLLPKLTAFELRGQGGVSSTDRLINSHRFDVDTGPVALRLPATWLSHGYQATVAWLADLVGHVLWEARAAGRNGTIQPTEMEGLVLIDELDLHLHPAWQVGLITALKRTLPRMQFVVTTHSPMLLSGLEHDEIIVLDQDPETGDIIKKTYEQSPKLQTSGGLLERYFGVDELDPTQLTAQFQRFGFLANNPYRSDAEDQEMLRLLDALTEAGVAPEWAPVPRSSVPHEPQ